MNLWTFVMLGFLAQSSNGCYEYHKGTFGKAISTEISNVLQSTKGNFLPDLDLSSITSLLRSADRHQSSPYIKDTEYVDTVCEHKNGSYWSFSSSGSFTVSSTDFTDLKLELQANGEMELVLESGHPILKTLLGKLSTSLKVGTPVTGTVTSNLAAAYMDSCILLLRATIQQALHSAIAALNVQFRRIIEPFTYLGNICRYQIREIQYTTDSIILHMDLVMQTAEEVTSITFYNFPVSFTELPDGWSSAIRISEDAIAGIMNTQNISYERNITAAEFEAYKIDVPGKKVLQVKQDGPFVHKITAAESRATAKLHECIRDEAGNLLTKHEMTVFLPFRFLVREGETMWFSFGDLKIEKPSLVSVDPRFSSGNDSTTNFESLLKNSITEAVGKMKSQLERPIHCPIPEPFALPKKSKCFNAKGVTLCGA